MPLRILPMGERALLVEVARLDQVLALRAGLETSRPHGVIDLVPAARTVLVQFDPAVLPVSQARAWIEHVAAARGAGGAAAVPLLSSTARAHVIEIRYDGRDLDDVADSLGLRRGELIARHLGARWTVAFTGFAPGFGYLVSEDWPLDIPRRTTPRTAVPAGSLGLAAEFSGIYPRETPGGWQLIGEAVTRMFDPLAEEPALLAPGDTVRFQVAP